MTMLTNEKKELIKIRIVPALNSGAHIVEEYRNIDNNEVPDIVFLDLKLKSGFFKN